MPSLKLTDRTVDRAVLEPGSDRLELWDTQTPGLGLRLTATGRKTWVLRYRTRDGRQPRMSIGTYPALGLYEARERSRELQGAVSRGQDPAALERRERALVRAEPIKTVEDLMNSYFAAVRSGSWRPRGRKKAASTIKLDEGVYARHLRPALGEARLEEVTPDLIKRVLRGVMERSGLQTNKAWSIGSQAFSFAVDELERLPENPFRRVRKLMPEARRDRLLSDPEMAAALAAVRRREILADRSPDADRVYVGAITRLALETTMYLGQRRSEVAGMERSELRLEEAEWTIRRERTKSKTRPHLVCLSPHAVRLIREAMRLTDAMRLRQGKPPSPFVFGSPRTETPLGPSALTHAMADIYRALGIGDATLHDWRTAMTTNLASPRGGRHRRFVLSMMLSHAAVEGARVTSVYDLYDYAEEKRAAWEAWADLLDRNAEARS